MSATDLFQFTSYRIGRDRRTIVFSYAIRKHATKIVFHETITLSRAIPGSVPLPLLRSVLEAVHLVLGISYYKTYVPRRIEHPYRLQPEQAVYWTSVYQNGLGEFCYRNRIDPKRLTSFKPSAGPQAQVVRFPRRRRALLGIGGGKDSIVAAEHLRAMQWVPTAFHLETSPSPLIDRVITSLGIPEVTIRRGIDKQLVSGLPGAFNGHVPISAIYAWIGVLIALVDDYRYVLVGNEASSSTGNVRWKDREINHQWSKSAEFERMTQEYLRRWVTPDIEYVSVLRPFSELRVLWDFSKLPNYFPVFSSCNRNFRISGARPVHRWCGECPKCAFVFLGLAAFLPKRSVIRIFGQDLLNKQSLESTYRGLLGFGRMKPFECVGTFAESRAAFMLASKKFGTSHIVRTFRRRIPTDPRLISQTLSIQGGLVDALPFQLLGMRSALLLGYGREGHATHAFLRRRYPWLRVGIADQSQGARYLDRQSDYEFVIKTPGIPSRMVTKPWTTATNLFFGLVDNCTIGVTGTKGKSTTASIIFHILKTAGWKVELLGNIGTPMLARTLRPIHPDTIFVLELSSYQLEDLRVAPDIAVYLNLFPEHLDYHGSFSSYADAKAGITLRQKAGDVFVYNPSYAALHALSRRTDARSIPFVKRLPSYGTKLIGAHNQDNIRAAVTVARTLMVSDRYIQKALATFKPLPHRLQVVGTYRGITFVDDAISTTPESTIAALRTYPLTETIFLGGLDRGYDFSALRKALVRSRVKNVVLFPDSGKHILPKPGRFNVLRTRSMRAAVAFAYRHTSPGAVCLLSCASPSYSLWKNFEEKGDMFTAAVRQKK